MASMIPFLNSQAMIGDLPGPLADGIFMNLALVLQALESGLVQSASNDVFECVASTIETLVFRNLLSETCLVGTAPDMAVNLLKYDRSDLVRKV